MTSHTECRDEQDAGSYRLITSDDGDDNDAGDVSGPRLSSGDVVPEVEKVAERSSDVCAGDRKQYNVPIFTASCSLSCVHDGFCEGFNIKDSHTCDIYDYKPQTSFSLIFSNSLPPLRSDYGVWGRA